MNTLLFLFNQTRNVANLEILSLLTIAAIIGYIAAWLYYTSIYTHKKKVFKFAIENLKKQIAIQSADIRNFEKSILIMDTELLYLKKQANVLKSLRNEDVINTDNMVLKEIQVQEFVRTLDKKTELVKRILDRKDKIYVDNLRYEHKHLAHNLAIINGIGIWIEERLNMLDLFTLELIANLTISDSETISEITDISPNPIKRDNWAAQAIRMTTKQTKIVIGYI